MDGNIFNSGIKYMSGVCTYLFRLDSERGSEKWERDGGGGGMEEEEPRQSLSHQT